MRTSIALAIVAATAVAAKDCNPSYNVAPSTECFTNCNVKAGSTVVPGWTMDHTSENFLPSLSLMCNKGTAAYGQFMAAAGMCMIGCAGDDPELFNAEFAGACAWYAEHKNDKCADDAATTTAAGGTTTTAAAGETTTTTASATTTVASAVSSVNAAASSAVSAVQSAVSAVSSAASAASSVAAAASSSAAPSAPAANAESAASKMQMSGFAMALVAGAGYLAL